MAEAPFPQGRKFAIGITTGFILLALGNQNWLVTPVGWLDPFIYINYFREFGDVNGEGIWANNYKASRVPWNIIGNIVTAVTGLYKAQFVLAVVSIAAIGFIGFQTAKRFGNQIGLMTVAIFVFFPSFHGNQRGGWLYQNSISGPLQATFVWLAFHILSDDDRPKFFRGAVISLGAIATLLAIVNTMQVLVLLPACCYLLVHFVRKTGLRDVVELLGYFVFGSFLAFLGTAGLSVLFGGPVRFYQPIYQTFDSYSGGYHEVWWVPWGSGWWREAGYLAAPLVLSGVGASQWCLSVIKKNTLSTLERFAIFSHLGAVAIWIGSYQFLKFHLLNYDYHAYPILVTSVFSFAASQSIWARSRSSQVDVPAIGGRVHLLWIAPIACLALPFVSLTISLGQVANILRGSFPEMLIMYLLLVITWSAVKNRRSLLALQVAALCLPLLSFPRSEYSMYSDCDAKIAGNQAVIELATKFNNSSKPVFLISDPGDLVELSPACSFQLDYVVLSLSMIYPFGLPPMTAVTGSGQKLGDSDFGQLQPINNEVDGTYEALFLTGKLQHKKELEKLLKQLTVFVPDATIEVTTVEMRLKVDLEASYVVIST